MDNGIDLKVKLVFGNHLGKDGFMNVVAIRKPDKVFPLIRGIKVVDDDDVSDAFLIAFPNKCAANKSRTACDYNHTLFTFAKFS
jgi:hypothetical protein